MSPIQAKSGIHYIRQTDVWRNIDKLIDKHIGITSFYLDLPNRHTALNVTVTNPTPDEKGVTNRYGYIHVCIDVIDDDSTRRLEVEGTLRYDCTQPIDLFKPNDVLIINHVLPFEAIKQFEGVKK